MITMIVALHNEEARFPGQFPILKNFLEFLGEPWELILVDDGSLDGTWAMAQELSRVDRRVTCLRLGKNLGQGAAVKLGVLASHGDVVLYTDADLSTPLSYARLLIDRIREDGGVAIASRWMSGSKIHRPQPAHRRFLGRVYYGLIHNILLPEIQDTNCGLKAYHGDTARVLFGFVRSWRWSFNVESLWLAKRMGCRINEIPVEWSHNEASRVHVLRDCIFTLWEIFNIKIRQLAGIYPVINR